MRTFTGTKSVRFRLLVVLVGMAFALGVSSLQAQVLVHQEPRHHLVYESGQIRILNVIMAPGDSSIYHIHHTPSLFIMLTNSETGSMLMGKEPSIGKNIAGTMIYEDLSAPHTRTHRVWNLDKDTFQVLDIELLSAGRGFAQAPLQMAGLQLEIDTARVRAYRIRLESGKNFTLATAKRNFVLVSFNRVPVATITNGKSSALTLARGGYIHLPAGQQFSIRQETGEPVQMALIELPNR